MKILRNIAIGLVALSILLYLLLRISAVQTYLTSTFSKRLSEDLETTITIDKVDISWFLNVVVEGVYMEDQQGNTLARIGSLEVDVDYLKMVDHKIHINNIQLDSLHFAYRKYKNDTVTNIQFLIDYFKSPNKDSTSTQWHFDIDGIDLTNTSFIYDIEDKADIKGFDHNHLDIRNIQLSLKDFRTNTDTIYMYLNRLEAKDKCGFHIQKMNSQLQIANGEIMLQDLILNSNYSKIHGNLNFEFDSWESWSNFISEVKMEMDFDSTYVSLKDITYFAPSLQGMDEDILLHGKMKGQIDRLKAKNIFVAIDLGNWFLGDFKIHGLPYIEKSFILVNAEKLRFNPHTLANLRLPGEKKLVLPDELNRLGKIKAEGRFTGFINDFVSNASFKTALGGITTDISLKPSDIQNALTYEGALSTSNLNIGKLFQTNRFGKVSLKGNIKGVGLDQFANALVDLQVASLDINGGIYQDIKLNAKLKNRLIDFHLESTDNRFRLKTKGSYDFSKELPIAELHARIDNARLGRFLMNNSKDTLGEISTHLHVHLEGNSIDNVNCTLDLDSTSYIYASELYYLEKIDILTSIKDQNRQLTLTSDYLDAYINGIYDIQELETNLHQVLNGLLPSLLYDSTNQKLTNFSTSTNQLDLALNFKETELINKLFLSNMELASGTSIESNYSANTDHLNLKVNAPYFKYLDYNFKHIKIQSDKTKGLINAKISIQQFQIQDSTLTDSIRFISTIEQDTINYHFHTGYKNNHKLQLDFDGIVNLMPKNKYQLSFKDATLWIADSMFQIENGNQLWFSDNEFGAHQLRLFSKSSSITADGAVNKAHTDSLNIKFNSFDLNNVDPYTLDFSANFDGILNGTLILNSVFDYVDFLSEMSISDFKLNDTYLGNTSINTIWNKDRNAANINLSIYNEQQNFQPLNIYGYYYPQSKTNNYDLFLNLSKFPAKAIESFLSSFSSQLEGDVSGKLTIKGKTASPQIAGNLLLDIRKFKVDYLNTIYSFKDEMVFEPTKFGFTNAKFYDAHYEQGDKNLANGSFELTHHDFKDIAIDLNIQPQDLMLLDTRSMDNDMFYGKAFGTGNVRISGPLNKLDFNVDVKTSSGTIVSVPILFSYEAKKADFITFISLDSTNTDNQNLKENIGSEYEYNMDLTFRLRPEAKIRIVMDETKNDVIEAKGTGDIRLTVDPDENVEIFGTYEISQGNYAIYGKDFNIRKGSKIVWDGDLEEAQLDIQAIYTVNAQIKDLLPDKDSTETKVNCIVNIRGSMYTPEISFDIELPDVESTVQQEVSNVLSVGGEKSQDIINRNFVYLLALGKFQPDQNNQVGDGSTPNQFTGAGATDILTGQINSILNKFSEDLEIGVDWNYEDKNTQEFAVELSYTFLDNRLIVNGKIGGGKENSQNSTDNSRLVGDVDIEYKISKDGNIRVKAYNKTNYNNPVSSNRAPYTQGVGLSWRKDFDKFTFKRKNKTAESDSTNVIVPEKSKTIIKESETKSKEAPKNEVK